MRYKLLTILALALQWAQAEEDFRTWNYFNDTELGEGRLLEYDDAYPLEDLKKEMQFTEDRLQWLQDKGQSGDFVRIVKLTLKVPPQPKEPGGKPDPKAEPELKDVTYPLPYFSDADQAYVLDWDWLRDRQPFFDNCLQVVLGEERALRKTRGEPDPRYDLIYLRDGSRKMGVVQNTAFALHAEYGRFEVPRNRLAAIQFGDGKGGYDLLVGVNNNRLSGMLDLPADAGVGAAANQLTFENDAGQQEAFRKEKVARIIFRVRSDELDGLGGTDSVLVRLGNGDAFNAKVSGGEFKISSRSIPAGDVTQIDIVDGRASFSMKNGGKENGNFAEEDLLVELDLGTRFNLYWSHLAQVFCEPGHRPAGTIVQATEPRAMTLNFERDEPGVLRTVSRTSALAGVLHAGDRIVSIDGRLPDFKSKDDSYELALEALFVDKTRPYFILGVQRGGRTFVVTLMRQEG